MNIDLYDMKCVSHDVSYSPKQLFSRFGQYEEEAIFRDEFLTALRIFCLLGAFTICELMFEAAVLARRYIVGR